MKDTPKKLGAVALAGVMVAGGTLQSGTIVSNAEGVNDTTSTKVSTMSDRGVTIRTKEELLKENKKRWEDLWREELMHYKRSSKNKLFKDVYGYINYNYRNRMDIIALGDKQTVKKIVEEMEFEFKHKFAFDFEPIECHYNSLEELKTGKPSNDDRVVNIRGTKLDYGGVPIHQYKKDNFYKISIGRVGEGNPVCHVLLYVKK